MSIWGAAKGIFIKSDDEVARERYEQERGRTLNPSSLGHGAPGSLSVASKRIETRRAQEKPKKKTLSERLEGAKEKYHRAENSNIVKTLEMLASDVGGHYAKKDMSDLFEFTGNKKMRKKSVATRKKYVVVKGKAYQMGGGRSVKRQKKSRGLMPDTGMDMDIDGWEV